MRTVVSRQSRLEGLHLLVKVAMDDHTKAQAVVCMRDGGFARQGQHTHAYEAVLTVNGVPLKIDGQQAKLRFVLEMAAFERGTTAAANASLRRLEIV